MGFKERLLDEALQQLPTREQERLKEHTIGNGHDIYAAFTRAYNAAREKQQACEARRWTWKIRGHVIVLRDEAERLIIWLDRFKNVGDVVANVDPLHAGLPWAGIRFVLEVCCQYPELHQAGEIQQAKRVQAAVTESRQMGAMLAGLQTALHTIHRVKIFLEYGSVLPDNHATRVFEKSLANLLTLVMGFLAKAIETFQFSATKRAYMAFFDTKFYENFDAQCNNVSQQLVIDAGNCDRELGANHRVQQQASLAQALTQLDSLADLKLSIDAVEVRQILSQLPTVEGASFDSYEEQHNPVCLEGTRMELLSRIESWSQDSAEKYIFWLNGMAGTGKSTIARTAAQSFQRQNRLAASFLFKRGERDRGHAKRFFPTIALQMARNLPSALQKLIQALKDEPEVLQKPLANQFETLIVGPFARLDVTSYSTTPSVIVVDALDECDDERDVRTILKLFTQTKIKTGLSIFITSRPELPIRLGFAEISPATQEIILQDITKDTIRRDITLFLEQEFDHIRKEYAMRRPSNPLPVPWPGAETIRRLVELTEPLFIFAITLCRFVADPKSNPMNRLSAYLQKPAAFASTKLDRTYQPIMNALLKDQDDGEDEDFAEEVKDLIGPIVMLDEPLSAKSLANLLRINTHDVSDKLDFLHSVLSVPPDEDIPVRLLHLSFRDYLLDERKRGQSKWWIDGQQTHKMLAQKCLELLLKCTQLKTDICELKEPATRHVDVGEQFILQKIPKHVAYACLHWSYHWYESKQSICDQDLVHQFLARRFLHWLEALAWLGHLPQSASQIANLHSRVKAESGAEVSRLIASARHFILRNRQIIKIAPLQLYSSALIFLPQKDLIRQCYSKDIIKPLWMNTMPKVPKHRGQEVQALEAPAGAQSSEVTVVSGVQFALNAYTLASINRSGRLNVWDIPTGEVCGELSIKLPYPGKENALAFSSDCLLLAFTAGKSIQIWDMESEPQFTIELPDPVEEVLKLCFSHDSKTLVAAADDGRLHFFNAKTGESQWTSQELYRNAELWSDPPFGDVRAPHDPIAVSLGDTWLVAAAHRQAKEITIWSTEPGEYLQEPCHVKGSTPMTVSHHGQMVFFTSFHDARVLCIYKVSNSQTIEFLKHDNYIISLILSPDDSIVAIEDGNGIELWNIHEQKRMQRILLSDSIFAGAFSPDNRTLAIADRQIISLIEINEGNERAFKAGACALPSTEVTLKSHVPSIPVQNEQDARHDTVTWWLRTSRKGKYLVSMASMPDEVILWDWANGKAAIRIELDYWCSLPPLLSPDGTLLALLDTHQSVHIWCLTNFEEMCVFPDSQQYSQTRAQRRMVFSSTGGMFATIAGKGPHRAPIVPDKALQIWDLTTKQELKSFEGCFPGSGCMQFSRNDLLLAAVCEDLNLRIWDLRTGKVSLTFGLAYNAACLAFINDDRLLAISQNELITIRDLESGDTVRQLTLVTGAPRSLTSSQDSQILAASCSECIELWDVASGEMLRSTPSFSAEWMEFSEDKMHIFTNNGCIHVHDACFDGDTDCSQPDALTLTGHWIWHRGKESLWLPHDYRPAMSCTSQGNAIAIGQDSGIVNIYGI